MIDEIDTGTVWRKLAPNKFEFVQMFRDSQVMQLVDVIEHESVFCRFADNLAPGVAALLVSNPAGGSMIAFARVLKTDLVKLRYVLFCAYSYNRYTALYRRAGVSVSLSIDIDGRIVNTNEALRLNAPLIEKSALSWAALQLQKVT
jgi:hypothetical protein